MLKMDQVHVIRHKHVNEGKSIRQIARQMGLHRATVRKYLEVPEPRREERLPRRLPCDIGCFPGAYGFDLSDE